MLRLFVFILLFFAVPAQAGLLREAEYVDLTCPWEIEHVNSDRTRVDCYSEKVSIEYDFGPKWADCIGQALFYSAINNNSAVCALIIESDNDMRYWERLDLVRQRPFIYLDIIMVRYNDGKPCVVDRAGQAITGFPACD